MDRGFHKRFRSNADAALKKSMWEKYIGIGIKETLCSLCSTYKISSVVNSGVEAGHIVASKYCIDEKLTVLHVFPCCPSCNNECSDICILDYLFCRQRLNALKKMIVSIYQIFIEEYANVLPIEEQQIWKILDFLYGPRKYPAGGGIQNRKAIYEIARAEQLLILADKLYELSINLQHLTKEYAMVASCEIKPMNL